MILPLAEIFSRRFFGAAIPGSGAFAATLTLWLGMLGAAIAARDGKLLTLATGEFLPQGPLGAIAHIIAGTIGALIATIFALGGSAKGFGTEEWRKSQDTGQRQNGALLAGIIGTAGRLR